MGETMKRLSVVLGAICALFLLGCATDDGYYKAMTIIETAKAEANGKKWDAIKAGLERATPETAALASQGIAFATEGGHTTTQTTLAPPESAFDKGLRLLTALTGVARVGVDFVDIKERGKTARQISHDNVDVEKSRGDTLAKVVDAAGRNGGTHIAAGGDVANAGSTIDKKNCSSGNSTGGPGAAGGNGAAGGSGTSTTGNSPGGAAAPGAAGGAGGTGGTTGGNCK